MVTVTDTSGNTGTCTFDVTVVDNEPPQISCPTNVTISNDPGVCNAVYTYTAPVGTDNCPGSTTSLVNGLGSGGTFPVGITTETYVVTSASGLQAPCSFTVHCD